MKRYLGVTSLLDELEHSPEPGARKTGRGKTRAQQELEFSLAMGSLISELMRNLGWAQNMGEAGTARPPRPVRSIFQPCLPGSTPPLPIVTVPPRRSGKAFRQRSEFFSMGAYGKYVQRLLRPGMRVRMLDNFEELSAGDEGEFRQSNNSVPPAQVASHPAPGGHPTEERVRSGVSTQAGLGQPPRERQEGGSAVKRGCRVEGR